MHRKTLILGVILLFIGSTVSPIAFGVTVEESEEATYLDDISYIYSVPDKTIVRNIDYTRNNQQYHSVNELNYYLEDPPSSPLGGPIDSAWPMASHDNNHTGLSPTNTSQNPYDEIWRYKTWGSVDTGITIDTDGTIYFGSFYGYLHALNPDGTLKWRMEPFDSITLSTPCIAEDGIIYIGGYKGLAAYYPNGTMKWKNSEVGNIASSPAVDDNGIIYIGNHDSEMIAVNPNGNIYWKYLTDGWIVSDPAITNDGTIIFGSADNYVYALIPNGALKWKYLTNSDVKGSASIDRNGIIYIASWGDYLHAIYPNGTMKWKTHIDSGTETTPCFGPDGTIYVSNKKLWAIKPDDGGIKWTYEYPEPHELSFLSNPAISADGIIYIGVDVSNEPSGAIYAINPNGTLRWRKYIANQAVYSSPAIGDDGTIYIGAWSRDGLNGGIGTIHAFNEKTNNYPPDPPTITFEGVKKLRFTPLPFSFKTTDPDNSPIQSFTVDWGDGTTNTKDKEYAPNEIEVFEHTYIQKGPFTIRAKAQDIYGLESDWGTLEISMPLSYHYPFWSWLQNQFPLLARILELLTPLQI